MYPEFGNYQAITLTSGMTATTNVTYFPGTGSSTSESYILGNGITAATVNRLYCISAGTLSITMMGGGQFTTPGMVAKDELFIVPSKVIVNSGLFIGFKPKRTWGSQRLTP